MPGNYTDTSAIIPNEEITSSGVADNLDALDDALKLVDDALDAVIAAPVITASATAAFSGETTLATALANPPAIGGTTPAAITGTTILAKPGSNQGVYLAQAVPNGEKGVQITYDSGSDDRGEIQAIHPGTTQKPLALNPAGGNVVVGENFAAAQNFDVSGAAGQERNIRLQTNKVNRWVLRCSTTAESGSNAGSNFAIVAMDDAGASLGNALVLVRSTLGMTAGGALAVTGALSKGSGSFEIPHPLDPENTLLVHSFIEGPRCDLIYRGSVGLKDGAAVVDLNAAFGMMAGTFEALCTNPQVFLQNESGWEPLKGRVEGALLHIVCKDPTSVDDVSWMVVAERQDDVIKAWDRTDENGRLVTEHPMNDETRERWARKAEIDAAVKAEQEGVDEKSGQVSAFSSQQKKVLADNLITVSEAD